MIIDSNCPEILDGSYDNCGDCPSCYECAFFGCIHFQDGGKGD